MCLTYSIVAQVHIPHGAANRFEAALQQRLCLCQINLCRADPNVCQRTWQILKVFLAISLVLRDFLPTLQSAKNVVLRQRNGKVYMMSSQGDAIGVHNDGYIQ